MEKFVRRVTQMGKASHTSRGWTPAKEDKLIDMYQNVHICMTKITRTILSETRLQRHTQRLERNWVYHVSICAP